MTRVASIAFTLSELIAVLRRGRVDRTCNASAFVSSRILAFLAGLALFRCYTIRDFAPNAPRTLMRPFRALEFADSTRLTPSHDLNVAQFQHVRCIDCRNLHKPIALCHARNLSNLRVMPIERRRAIFGVTSE